MPITVRPADGRRDFGRFVDLPWSLYRDDPRWVPPLRRDVADLFDARKNPFFEHAEVRPFLAENAGRVVGRIAAIVNRAHNAFHGDRVGFFGFFECEDDVPAARALFGAAAEWAGARGMTALRGPMNFSTNDDCGSLILGFDTAPMIMMPHNPPYHARLYEECGFAKEKDLLAYHLTVAGMPERLARGAEAIRRRRKIAVRPLRMREFGREVERIWEVYNDAWERNWGFVPMTRAEMLHMAAQLRPAVDPAFAQFAEIDGETVGFGVALPDWNLALAHANGRLFPFGAVAIWWHSRRIRQVRVLTLGLRKGARFSGADTLMIAAMFESAAKKGVTAAEMSWVLEDNTAMRQPIERLGGRVYKTYRVYEKPL